MADVTLQTDPVIRKINVGRITGLSAYELAVKHGFVGTEEDYVKKQNELYLQMVEVAKNVACFSKFTCDGNSIESDFNKNELIIKHDDCIDVKMDPSTYTMEITLNKEFKESLVFKNEDTPDTQS